MKRKLIITGIFSFAAGFVIHALFFPYVLTEKQVVQAEKDIGYIKDTKLKATPADQVNDLITYVDYAEGNFHPTSVTITRGNYVSITNRHKKEQMWLNSEAEFLSTVRPYATGERLQTTIAKPGTYTVIDKNNPDAKLTIVVK
jgi:plastocyanin